MDVDNLSFVLAVSFLWHTLEFCKSFNSKPQNDSSM